MVVKPVDVPFGWSAPPYGPHTVTMHIPGWKSITRIRDGDPTIFAEVRDTYPRFMPWGIVRRMSAALHKMLELPPSHFVFPYAGPDGLRFASRYSVAQRRGTNKLAADALSYRVVDFDLPTSRVLARTEGEDAANAAITTIRIYAIVYPLSGTKGVVGAWQDPGLGVSTRLAEDLLPLIEAGEGRQVTWEGGVDNLPEPTWLPLADAHQQLKERIVSFYNRAPANPEKMVTFHSNDVYLFPTGMAAIYRSHLALQAWKPGFVVGLGSLFNNTAELLRDAEYGYKHFGQVAEGGKALNELEAWLEEAEVKEKGVSYVFAEFPSNILLETVDVKRLRELADKHHFAVVIDDTIGSVANVDLSSAADLMVTSTTKSFSGYADVMGGSAVLNPSMPAYAGLGASFAARFHNEVYARDAAHLLSNSADFLERSTKLNANAAAIAAFFAAELERQNAEEKSGAILRLHYPSYSSTRANYDAFKRAATPDFTPGYGGLLSVDFADEFTTTAFYDNLHVIIGMHLGAHRTLAVPLTEMQFGRKTPEELAYHESYGMHRPNVRIAAGLEDPEQLVEIMQHAVTKMRETLEAKKRAGGEAPLEAVTAAVAGAAS